MKMYILSRYSGVVIAEHDAPANTVTATVAAAVTAGVWLRSADLRGASLSSLSLCNPVFIDADLAGADFSNAQLDGPDFRDANLRNADFRGAKINNMKLRGASTAGADFSGATVDGELIIKNPVSISQLYWHVLITDRFLRIGCKRFLIEQWRVFSDDEISQMDQKALEFWRKHKNFILALCDEYNGNKILSHLGGVNLNPIENTLAGRVARIEVHIGLNQV